MRKIFNLDTQHHLIECIKVIKSFEQHLNSDELFKLEMIIDEIGSNAVKYGREGRLIFEVDHDNISLIFESTGDKIPEDYLNDDENFVINESMTRGGGLGLYLVKQLATFFDYEYENNMNIIRIRLEKEGV